MSWEAGSLVYLVSCVTGILLEGHDAPVGPNGLWKRSFSRKFSLGYEA